MVKTKTPGKDGSLKRSRNRAAKKTQKLPIEEGEGELFEARVEKVGNGYILSGGGHTMVFSDDKYPNVIEWVVSRRLAKMECGEVIDIKIEQRFVKVNPKNENNA